MTKTTTTLLASSAGFALAIAVSSAASAKQGQVAGERIQLAQACGWYAITHCSRSYSAARRFARNNGSGRIIDTSSRRFPNFTPGYYCIADGPMGRGSAASAARALRRQGFSDAYAKSAC